jgi:hypothetical protein
VRKAARIDNDYQRVARELEEAAKLVRAHVPSGSPIARRLEGFARKMRDNKD